MQRRLGGGVEKIGEGDEAGRRRADRDRELDRQALESGLQRGRILVVADHDLGAAVGQHVLRLRRRQPPVQAEQRAAQLADGVAQNRPFDPDLGPQHHDVAGDDAASSQAMRNAVCGIVELRPRHPAIAFEEGDIVGAIGRPILNAVRQNAHFASLPSTVATKRAPMASRSTPSGSTSHCATDPRRPARISALSVSRSMSGLNRPAAIPALRP
ncbi:hypothetical protein chiPu_0031151, partial [Chiloscyllium punctatum]|nr:hypothetical protein [Chiloscyllium punctatum]